MIVAGPCRRGLWHWEDTITQARNKRLRELLETYTDCYGRGYACYPVGSVHDSNTDV